MADPTAPHLAPDALGSPARAKAAMDRARQRVNELRDGRPSLFDEAYGEYRTLSQQVEPRLFDEAVERANRHCQSPLGKASTLPQRLGSHLSQQRYDDEALELKCITSTVRKDVTMSVKR